MDRRAAVFAVWFLVLDVAVTSQTSAPSTAGAPGTVQESATRTVKQYCAGCHSDRGKAGDLSLVEFDVARASEHPETSEKIVRKLRAGMMPPAGARRPDDATLLGLRHAIEMQMDRWAAAHPNPGWRPFQRLTRAEYTHAVGDLLDVAVDATAFLPPDTMSQGFDNIADTQAFSPALPQGYLRAASQISRLAVGDRSASAATATYRVPATENQMLYVEGTPFGSRGGTAFVHTFPADGLYTFQATLVRTVSGELFGNTAVYMAGKNELLEISVNGERAAVIEVDYGMSDAGEKGLTLETPPIAIKAGPQRIAAAFVPRSVGPVDDLLAPIEFTLVDTRIGTGYGVTMAPHLQDLAIAGPLSVTGVSETPSRRKIFSCYPTAPSQERRCAGDILRRLATQAYRGPVRDDVDDLLAIYDRARKDGGDFEDGIRFGIQGILANPRFMFRTEQTVREANGLYRLTDVDLASRLSFFLWGTLPDEALLKAATDGTLRNPAVFDRHVKRMLADSRSRALATRFAAQWLRLQDVDKVRPDGLLFPRWDASLSESFVRETELFFDSIVRENRSVLELITADYTFVNERLARHYGIPNVTGPQFRRVPLPEPRRGLLTQGSVLLLTSVADRTSPVQRGKWVLQVLLGSPPPPPPPDVPAFEDTKGSANGRFLSVRERMEQHRSNPACLSCHRVIDPIGLALENFDVTGQHRIKDNGVPVDSNGQLYDGTEMQGPAGLRNALLKHRDAVLMTFAENLMTYALGRRIAAYDMPALRAIVRSAETQNYSIQAFVAGVARSAAFQMSRPGPVETAMSLPRRSSPPGGRAKAGLPRRSSPVVNRAEAGEAR
jgi:mono/diheme cytochrome c family protein